nr:PREDICTED: MMS19 nucleotide excision repair protein homolog [Latimeria chalumnae]|eukprot:XP_006014334.2 PREDICTED: MMS19 nucleotide excision repair protein homolog [Latimeria chalumnae]
MEASGSLAKTHPDAFISKMVPVLSQELQTEPMETNRKEAAWRSAKTLRQRSLQALSAISTHPSIVKETVPVLLHYLRQAQKGCASSESEDVISACRSLQLVAKQCQQTRKSIEYFHQTAVPCLLGLAVQAAMQGGRLEPSCRILCDEAVLTAMVPVITTACSHLLPE